MNDSGTVGVYDGYYIALDFNQVTSDVSDVSAIYAKVKVNDEPAYDGVVDEDNYLLIQVAADGDTDLDDAVLTITAVDESGDLPVELYKNEYALFGVQLVVPEPPVPVPVPMEGIAPDADFGSQNITINESDGEITGKLTATTVGGDSGYFISLNFSSVTSDMSDIVNITYLATDVRSETVDSGSVSDNIATIFVAEPDAENILAQTVVVEAVDSDNQVIYQNVYDISAITLGE